MCSEPFEGAEGNLKKIIITQSNYTDESNSVHHCVSRLFSLLRLWDYENPHSDKINQECQVCNKTYNVKYLLIILYKHFFTVYNFFQQDLLTDIENCLTMDQIEPNNTNCLENMDNIETYLQNCKNRPTLYLTDDMVFKIVTICLMSISRLKNKESNEVQGVVAITLAVLSQLLEFIITKLQQIIIEMAMPDVETVVKGKNTYCTKLKNVPENQASSESRNNGDHMEEKNSTLNKDNNVLDLDENNKAKSSDNGITSESGSKKIRDKSKSLLNKLRRRKRKTSSDSDASDVDQSTLASSSDEINSDVSETEEDALSEGNDALSDDNTDDEEISPENKIQSIENVEQVAQEEMNGHGSNITKQTENCDKSDSNHLVNGQQYSTDQQTESKAMDDKDSITNSSSGVTITNTDSTSTFEESNDHLCNTDNIFYMAQLKKRSLKSDDILNMLVGKEILVSVKVCCDWLRSNPDIVRICAKSSRTLLKRVTILLNLIDVDIETLAQGSEDSTILSSVEKLKEYVKMIPLPEDIDLRGLNLLENAHKALDWQILRKHRINKREETLLRVLKLIEFGHHLCSVENSRMQYDQTERLFTVTDASSSNAPKVIGLDEKHFGPEHSKGKLMRHMGKLWLNAEVRALESQLRSRLMSPYLVPDHEALAKHTPALKRLVYAKKFIVVIPAVGK